MTYTMTDHLTQWQTDRWTTASPFSEPCRAACPSRWAWSSAHTSSSGPPHSAAGTGEKTNL